ncbi:hypothetical protein TNCV_4091701 [Trichonephila clavipes]|nr:hypothetical protein TNCV_4091701 [Trichonephila clavipes]
MKASKKEREMVQFLALKEARGHTMHRWMNAVYGEYSLCRSSVVEKRKRFPDVQCGKDENATVSGEIAGTPTVESRPFTV